MSNLPKMLILLGLTITGVGILFWAAQKLPEGNLLQKLGKLPGDLRVEKENYSFYFPWVTCLVISAVVSLFAWMIQKIR